MKRAVVFALAAALAVAVARGENPPKQAESCKVRVQNGSVILGTLAAPREVSVKVKGATRTVSFDDVWSLQIGVVKEEEADRIVTSQGTIEGWTAEMPDFRIDTGYGILTIPSSDVVSVVFRRPVKDMAFDFSRGGLDGWTSTGKSAWTVADGVLRTEPAGTGDMLLLAPILGGTFTLEVDVACDNWAAILIHAQGPTDSCAFWLMPGTAGFYANPDWTNHAVRTWPVPTVAGRTAHVKLAVDGTRAKAWIDGTYLGEAVLPSDAGRVGFAGWTAPATFDNLAIRGGEGK